MSAGWYGLLLMLLIGTLPARATVLIHDYELNNSAADAFGGASMILPQPSGLGSTGYDYTAGFGPNLSNAINASEYSLELNFSVTDTTSWVKILDFKNLTSDNGLYNYYTNLQLYPLAAGQPSVIAANCPRHVIVTRDGTTKIFRAYVNGALQLDLTDNLNYGVFTGAGNIIHFLKDDTVTGGAEAADGLLDFVRIYSGVLSATQVSNLVSGTASGALAAPSVSGTNALCTNDTLSLTASAGYSNYQWRKNGVDIAAATAATYTQSTIVSGDAGKYSVAVTGADSCPVASAETTVTVDTAPPTPSISGDTGLCTGATLSLSVPAGYGSYQWYLAGVAIAGATSATYTKAAVAAADAGAYTVTVGNSCGSAFASSPSATVTVNAAATPATPALTGTTLVAAGSELSLSTDSGYTSYQWNRHGIALASATSATYILPTAATTDSGLYSVTVTNAAGCPATSAPLNVSVIPLHDAGTADFSRGGGCSLSQNKTLDPTFPLMLALYAFYIAWRRHQPW